MIKNQSFDLTRQLLRALALRDRDDAIKPGHAQGFQCAVSPFYFEFVEFGRSAEADVERRLDPYRWPETFPETPAHLDYLERYNTRVVSAPLPKLVISNK
jgi:hypothetical protein